MDHACAGHGTMRHDHGPDLDLGDIAFGLEVLLAHAERGQRGPGDGAFVGPCFRNQEAHEHRVLCAQHVATVSTRSCVERHAWLTSKVIMTQEPAPYA